MSDLPAWLAPDPFVETVQAADDVAVDSAIHAAEPGIKEFAALISPAAGRRLEEMAQRAQDLTRRHFGRTISLYVPLYLSNYCPGGCAYCGYASDRKQPRRKLEQDELFAELSALKDKGFEDVLLLTGERTAEADFDYLRDCVAIAARTFHNITVESFSMTEDEYRALGDAGCTGITLYQETYDPLLYAELHRWGPKQDYMFRLEAPARALAAGLRTAGIGVLLGLADPARDALALCQHVEHLKKHYWQAGVLISFPRICSQKGGYVSAHPVTDKFLAQLIFAFRICFHDVPLVLSTRENETFRDGIAGVGISRMSVASRTTVGGYHSETSAENGQFNVTDQRDVRSFCAMLGEKGLEPVFKNWDSVFQVTGSPL